MKEPMRLLLAASVAAASALGCGDRRTDPEVAQPGLVHVLDDQLLDPLGAPLTLEGIGFSDGDPAVAYPEIAALGMNHVRLYFSASTFESASAPGEYDPKALAWLDEHVARAREHGLYLVLALNVPPGGSFFDCGNNAFWDSAEHQDRLLELWRLLATRYANEPAIAGYAVLDPINPNRTLDQWQELAERATQTIREVDPRHTLFLGRALSLRCEFDKLAIETFARMSDANVVYEFDRAQPWSYVAQLLRPAGDPEGDMVPEFGKYPDETSFTIDHSKSDWIYSSEDSRPSGRALKLKPDETEWTRKVFYYTVTDPQFAYAIPVLQADATSGKAYYDDVLIEEVSDSGSRVIADIDIESTDGWYFWQGTGDGEEQKDAPGVASVEQTAHRGQASVAIRGTTGYANLAGQDWAVFLVALGRTYRVTSWVKGEGILETDMARVRLDFYRYSEPLHGFDRRTLEGLFTDFMAWGRAARVPMFVNGFATGRPSFENGRGGLSWVSDMIDIMREHELGFVYWGYNDRDFGLYSVSPATPEESTLNQPLADLLREKLR
jgi:endoglucanase